MSVYRLIVMTKEGVKFLKNQQVKGKNCRFAHSGRRIVTYIPGTHMMVISSDDEYTLLKADGELSFLSRKELSEMYRSLPDLDTETCIVDEFYELFQSLLDYIGPGNALKTSSAVALFDLKAFMGITFYAIRCHVSLEFTEESYLNSSKYHDLLAERVSEDNIRLLIKSDFSIAMERPLHTIMKDRAREEVEYLLSLGSTVNHSVMRNTIVECIRRLHIDCLGYLTTGTCIQFIRDALGIQEEIKDSTFRHYVDEAKASLLNHDGKKNSLWVTAILPDHPMI